MAIILACQTKMPTALHGIFCLFHTSQSQTADQRLLVRTLNLLNQFLDFLGMNLLLTGFESITKIADKQAELFNFLRIRSPMRSVYKRCLHPEKMLCHRLIGKKHEIFNQLGGYIALVGHNIRGMSLLIQKNLRLRKIKINGATLMSAFTQNRCQLLHLPKHRHQRLVFRDGFRIAILQNFLYISITHPAIDPNHGFCNLVVNDFSLFVYRHEAGQG